MSKKGNRTVREELEKIYGKGCFFARANGAGKSTLIKILAGAFRADAGEIILDGKKIEINNPWEAQDLGIIVMHQEINAIPALDVSTNISLRKEEKEKINNTKKEEKKEEKNNNTETEKRILIMLALFNKQKETIMITGV